MEQRAVKRKVGGSAISGEVKQELNLLKTDMPMSTVRATTKGGKTHYRSASKSHNTANGTMSAKKITDLLCPIFEYKRIGYGHEWTARTYDNTAINSTAGSSRAYQWAGGRQHWCEYLVMPVYNAGTSAFGAPNSAFQQDNFSGNIAELIMKADDIRNGKENNTVTLPIFQSDFIVPAVAPLNGTVPIGNVKRLYGMSFDYHGGYQEHSWTNPSSSQITIFVTECQPRQVMSCIRSLGQIANGGQTIERFTPITVGLDVLEDYKANLPLSNSLKPQFNAASNNNTSTDEITDPHVKITANSNRTHYKWKVGKEIKITLAPGERYTHRVAIDPFSFTESAWNKLVNTDRDHAGVSIGQPAWSSVPMVIPAISKMLVVRATTEVGWAQSGANVSAVGLVPGALLHTCTEYHKCRILPYQFKTSMFLDYWLDNGATRIINTETDEAENTEVGGLAEDSTMPGTD